MEGVVRFKRVHNRTAEDIFKTMIQPKMIGALNDAGQKITHYNKHNHTYQNQTGALEGSISWTPPVQKGPIVRMAILAGGLSKAQFSILAKGDKSTIRNISVRAKGRSRKLRFGKIALVGKGDQIFVDYAKYVENKGYPVLKQGIEYFRHKLAEIFGKHLRVVKA